ncbi:mucin-2-like [Dermacentor albipictus]|uniref:mucin-2-like n=1 Tax=Dermacentor albipictus TaxID=60249 RepID=UPI0031FDC563
MRTVWLLVPLLGVSLAASLGDIEPSSLIGRRELRRPALFLEAQRVSNGAAGRRQGVLFKTLSNFGGRRRLSAPSGPEVAASVDPASSESTSDDAVASLINHFGGVINQKRRLGDDDAVSEDGDELVTGSSGTKSPLLGAGFDGKPSVSDDGPAWTPTYGGSYRKEPELQSNYKALLSEPDFGPSVPRASATLVGGSAVGVQAAAEGTTSNKSTKDGASEQDKNLSEIITAKSEDSKDCKDKTTKKDAEVLSSTGDDAPVMHSEIGAFAGNTASETSDQQPAPSKGAPDLPEHVSDEDDEDYEDDEEDYEDDEEHAQAGDATKKDNIHDATPEPTTVRTAINETSSPDAEPRLSIGEQGADAVTKVSQSSQLTNAKNEQTYVPSTAATLTPSQDNAAVFSARTEDVETSQLTEKLSPGTQAPASMPISTASILSSEQQDPREQQELTPTVSSLEVDSNVPGLQHRVVNGVSREAAEAEIIAILKLRAGKNGTSEQPSTQSDTVSGSESGRENAGISTDTSIHTTVNEQVNVPPAINQKGPGTYDPATEYSYQGGSVVLVDRGAASEAGQGNVPLSGTGDFSEHAVPESVISDYGSPDGVGVFYSLGNIASHGSFPSDTAAFVAETPAMGLPQASKQQNGTLSLGSLNNETAQNVSTKMTGEEVVSQEPGKNSTDVGTYQMALPLDGTIEGAEQKTVDDAQKTHTAEGNSSTSFFAGTDSASMPSEKKLSVNDLEKPTGISTKPGFQGISINITDAQTPIDVSGIVMTSAKNESSTPPRPKPSTTITDSTTAVVVEGGNPDAPIDVSGIATSSETPTDEETPNQVSTESDAGSVALKPLQNETRLYSIDNSASTKTKDDCKDGDAGSSAAKSPHGEPVLFGAALETTAVGATGPAADEHISPPQKEVLSSGATANVSKENRTEQNNAPSNEPTEKNATNDSVPSQGNSMGNGSESQSQQMSLGFGTGYSVEIKLAVTDDNETSTSSTPLTTGDKVMASIPGNNEAKLSSVTSASEVTPPSARTMTSEYNDRELGGVDAPEPISSNVDKPTEESIATVVSQMMGSNESSKSASVSSQSENNVLLSSVKHTPLPISSVSISPVGHSTATLPALGYATVKEIQIASQPALAPKLKGPPSTSASTSADNEQESSQQLNKGEVVERVLKQDNASQTMPPRIEAAQTVTTPPELATGAIFTVDQIRSDITVSTEAAIPHGAPAELTSTPASSNTVVAHNETSTPLVENPVTEPTLFVSGSGVFAEQPPKEHAPDVLSVSTETPVVPAEKDDVPAQSLNETKFVLGAAPEGVLLNVVINSSEVAQQASIENVPQNESSSVEMSLVSVSKGLLLEKVSTSTDTPQEVTYTEAPSHAPSAKPTEALALQNSTPAVESLTTEKPSTSTHVDVRQETTPASTPAPSSSTTPRPTTTENPDVATMQTATEGTMEVSSTTERASSPDTTVATPTLPTVHLPRRPHITQLGHPKRPLFPARPSSFSTTVAQRRLRPLDRVSSERSQAQPTSTQTPISHPVLSSANNRPADEEEHAGLPVTEMPNTPLRRPHYRRPVTGDGHVTTSGKVPGRHTGRRRKPGSRGGKRRTTTTPPPQGTTTVATDYFEETNPGHSANVQFGARIGTRVPQGTRRPVPTTQQAFGDSEPVPTDINPNRPAKPRRTKRPKTRPVTRPPGTEYNDVRYTYTTPTFVMTRVSVDKEAAYETAHEAYITDVSPASTTYRTKSPLVAEVTLPSTESADRNAVSTVEYDEPLNDEPDVPNTAAPNQQASAHSDTVPAQTESFDEQLLQNEHDVNVRGGVTKGTSEVPETPDARTDGPVSRNNGAPVVIDNEDRVAPGISLGPNSPSFSTLEPTTPYGSKLSVGASATSETPSDIGRGMSHVEYTESSVTDGLPAEVQKVVSERVQDVLVTAGEIANDSQKAVTQAAYTGPSTSGATQSDFERGVSEEFGTDGTFSPNRYHLQHPTTSLPTREPAKEPENTVAKSPAGEPTSAATANEALPSTPAFDISRITTTTTPKPVQETHSTTTKQPSYPPLPKQPANPVAVFLVGGPGQDQSNTPAQKGASETTKAPQTTVLSEDYGAGGPLQGRPPSDTSRISQVAPFSTTKRPELDVPPSFLIPNNPRQPQAAVYGQTGKPDRLAQINPAAVVPNTPGTDYLPGTRVNIAQQQNTAVSSSTPTSRAPYSTLRPQSAYVGEPASETTGSGFPIPLQRGNAVPNETRPRPPPSVFDPPQNYLSTVYSDGASKTRPLGTLTKQPSNGSVPPSAGASIIQQARPPAPTTKFPISSTSRPRVPTSYVPQPAFLEPLGLQVRPFIVPESQKQASGSQSRKPASYLHSLGLELSKYQLHTVQLPPVPTEHRETADGKVQTLTVQGSRGPSGQTHQGTTSSTVPRPNPPTYSDGTPIRPNPSQPKRQPNVSQGQQAISAYVQPLGLQVAYFPEGQRNSANNAAASSGFPQSGARVLQNVQPALPKQAALKRPQVPAIKSQQQTFTPVQQAQRIPFRDAGLSGVRQPIRQNKPGAGLAPAAGYPTEAQVQGFVAPKAPLSALAVQRASTAKVPPRASNPSETLPTTQQPRPFSLPQGQQGQRAHIGQAHTRIYFSPPVPANKNGSKQPPLPISPFFLSIRHDQVVQENGPFPDIGKTLNLKQLIPADIVLPVQKTAQPTRAAAVPRKPSAASEALLQIPQTSRPTRVKSQKAAVSAPIAAARRPSFSPNYAPPTEKQGVVRQIILSPATGPIPYQPKSIVPVSQPAAQQGTQGVYKVSTYVPVASASLPGRPGLTATSYVPTTPDGQVLKVTSVEKPTHSSVSQVAQNGAQGAVVRAVSAPGALRQQLNGPVTVAQPSPASVVDSTPVQVKPTANVHLPQGLVQSPQQQVVQVTSYVPQGSPQAHQPQRAYLQQIPAQQPYSRAQQPTLGLQLPVFYAAAPQPSAPANYYPSAAGVIGHIRQYPPQQFQTVYAVPQAVRTSGTNALGTSQPVYASRGNPSLQPAVAPTGNAQGFAPIVYARPPVTLIERRPFYGYQQPVYVAASSRQLAQSSPRLTGTVNQLRQPLTSSLG